MTPVDDDRTVATMEESLSGPLLTLFYDGARLRKGHEAILRMLKAAAETGRGSDRPEHAETPVRTGGSLTGAGPRCGAAVAVTPGRRLRGASAGGSSPTGGTTKPGDIGPRTAPAVLRTVPRPVLFPRPGGPCLGKACRWPAAGKRVA